MQGGDRKDMEKIKYLFVDFDDTIRKTVPNPSAQNPDDRRPPYKIEEVYSHKFSREGDLEKGSTDTPQLAMALNTANQRTSVALA